MPHEGHPTLRAFALAATYRVREPAVPELVAVRFPIVAARPRLVPSARVVPGIEPEAADDAEKIAAERKATIKKLLKNIPVYL